MCPSSDCPRGFNMFAAGASLFLLAALILYALLNPDGFARQLAKDNSPGGAGAIENLTVIVLIPGILSGLYSFWRYRDRLPHPFLGYWVLAWSAACIYFAGEEASWGQWYFHWQTPEFIADVNRQGETNVHNITSWLNEKPRALVDVFIFVVGFLIPLWRLLGNKEPIMRRSFLSDWEGWVYAPTALLSAGLMFTASKIAGWLPESLVKDLGNGELREFLIAWFLMWYLISYVVRLRRVPAGSKS